MQTIKELVAEHAGSVNSLSRAIEAQKQYIYIQPIRIELRYQDSILEDINQACSLADGWDWLAAYYEWSWEKFQAKTITPELLYQVRPY